MSLLWLKNVPWGTILANAPGLVDGAKKLASSMRTRSSEAPASTPSNAAGDPQSRLATLEARQQEAADLLRALADQNAEMTLALAALRKRAQLHLRIALAALAVSIGTLAYLLLR
jgi:hypothetical protein